jgi:NhaA family Na+:H+ antiporter
VSDGGEGKGPERIGFLAAPIDALQDFLDQESAGGLLLMLASLISLLSANGPWGGFRVSDVITVWIDNGPMTIFFLLVSLEIKRELVVGELSSPARFAFPAVAALGGMMIPAVVYLAWNAGGSAWRGWAIPSATDIAFSLGVLSLIGRGAPQSLRIFLAALAILDDLAAIVVIALFYAGGLSWFALLLAGVGVLGLAALNLGACRSMGWYLLFGFLVWVCLLSSGVHATLAGVLLGMALPVHGGRDEPSLLERIEHRLHPWVSFLVLPLFAFAHAGLRLSEVTVSTVTSPVFIGIVVALLLGKPLGVFGASWAFVRWGRGRLPEGVDWRSFLGAAWLTGIGFTMSLFIGGLAFGGGRGVEVRAGVLIGSVLSALCGAALLRWNLPGSRRR